MLKIDLNSSEIQIKQISIKISLKIINFQFFNESNLLNKGQIMDKWCIFLAIPLLLVQKVQNFVNFTRIFVKKQKKIHEKCSTNPTPTFQKTR